MRNAPASAATCSPYGGQSGDRAGAAHGDIAGCPRALSARATPLFAALAVDARADQALTA